MFCLVVSNFKETGDDQMKSKIKLPSATGARQQVLSLILVRVQLCDIAIPHQFKQGNDQVIDVAKLDGFFLGHQGAQAFVQGGGGGVVDAAQARAVQHDLLGLGGVGVDGAEQGGGAALDQGGQHEAVRARRCARGGGIGDIGGR